MNRLSNSFKQSSQEISETRHFKCSSMFYSLLFGKRHAFKFKVILPCLTCLQVKIQLDLTQLFTLLELLFNPNRYEERMPLLSASVAEKAESVAKERAIEAARAEWKNAATRVRIEQVNA